MLCKICIDMLQFQKNPLQPEGENGGLDAIPVNGKEVSDAYREAGHGQSSGGSNTDGNISSKEAVKLVEEVRKEEAIGKDDSKKTSKDQVETSSDAAPQDHEEDEESKAPIYNSSELSFGHHQTPLSLVNSADMGCYICEILLRDSSASQRESRSDEEQEHKFYTKATIQSLTDKPGTYFLSITSRMRPFGVLVGSFDINETLAAEGEPYTYSTDYTGSDESIQTANWWVHTCLRTHKSCNRERGFASWFPTRLLYLGNSAIHDSYVRLIHTANEPPTGPYVTLSHRWGGSNFIQLNRANIKALQDKIPLETMPKTFQDAVCASRKLGVRYLWIDSLCISQDQDDRSDWLREAAVMDKVYSNSFCNISASDAEDSSNGLYRKHEPHTLDHIKVNLCLKGMKEGAEFAQCMLLESYFWLYHIAACPLNRRGWVFQERVLTPRILHFGRSQLSWECREQTACESYPLGIPEPSRELFRSTIKTQLDIGGLKITDRNRWAKFNKTWEIIVGAYSQTLLTVPSDRLIAVSGIAKRMAALGDNTYLAGMWRKDLERQLLWRNARAMFDREKFSFSRPIEYRAPSWSWASIDSPIMLSGWKNFKNLMAQVVDVVLEYATDDITGLVTGGWLDIKGTLRPGSLSRDKNEWKLTIQEPAVDKPSQVASLDIREANPSAFDDDNAAQRLFFVPFATWTTSWLIGLILRLRVDLGRGTFERVGWANFPVPEEALKSFLADMKRPQPDDLPCLRYEDGKQVFRII